MTNVLRLLNQLIYQLEQDMARQREQYSEDHAPHMPCGYDVEDIELLLMQLREAARQFRELL